MRRKQARSRRSARRSIRLKRIFCTGSSFCRFSSRRRSRLRCSKRRCSKQVGPVQKFHRADEAVASARNRLHVNGLLVGVTKNLPQLIDGGIHIGVKIYVSIGTPKTRPELFARNDFAVPLKQGDQYLANLAGQTQARAIFGEVQPLPIELECSEPRVASGKSAAVLVTACGTLGCLQTHVHSLHPGPKNERETRSDPRSEMRYRTRSCWTAFDSMCAHHSGRIDKPVAISYI